MSHEHMKMNKSLGVVEYVEQSEADGDGQHWHGQWRPFTQGDGN